MSEHDAHEDQPSEPNLGEVAQASLSIPGTPADDGAQQQPLPGTDYTVVAFYGLKYTMLEQIPPIGTMLQFVVNAQVVGHARDRMANETIRNTVKVRPSEIVLIEPVPAVDGGDHNGGSGQLSTDF